MRRLLAVPAALAVLLPLLGGGGAARASSPAPAAWPPPLAAQSTSDFYFVHYGEGHHNEDGGPVANGEIFRQTNMYAARFLAFSSDMATTGSVAELQSFENYIDEGFSPICPKAPGAIPCQTPLEVPWFHSVGNHDRLPLAGPGGVLSWTNANYRTIFADNAAPWGDVPLPSELGFSGSPDDGPGASTHYYVDYGPVRLISIDNSCHSITMCDVLTAVEAATGQPVGQHPAGSQWQFLEQAAREAGEAGRLVFVFMHEPTRDPRYPGNVSAISVNHTMNKGPSGDNQTFEAVAATTGVDAVLLGHIKGNNVYEALGVPYYIDGGGGGKPYTFNDAGAGVDSGGYYGYRIFRITNGAVAGRWLVPLADSIEVRSGSALVSGSITVPAGQRFDLDAIAVQPSCTKAQFSGCSNQQIRVELRPPQPPLGFEWGVPAPAYLWHADDPAVLAPVGEGTFDAVAPGSATVSVVTGWTSASITVQVV